MAVALDKLEEQLNCSICLDTYTNPKQLECNHVFCQKCLIKLVIRNQQGQLSLTCPICRQPTPVPAIGVAGLQSAFQINKFLQIVEDHKKAKAGTATAAIRMESASSSVPHKRNTVVCPEHDGREAELYCETCGDIICMKCAIKGSKHHSHEYEELDKAFKRYKGEIMSSLEPMEKQLTVIKKELKQLDARYVEISDQEAAVEADIHKAFTRLHQTLNIRETMLVGQLHQLTQAKLKSLAVQRDQIETTQTQLSSCLHFLRENLNTNPAEVLTMKSTTIKQVKELSSTFQKDMLEPKAEANMVFSALANLITLCQNYGKVYVAYPPDPLKCCITGKGVDTAAAVGEMSTAILQILNCKSEPCKAPMTSISSELVSEVAGTRTRGCIRSEGESEYKISYQPTVKGRHQLHIQVEGQQISGSPFPVIARRSPEEKLSTPFLTICLTGEPEGVTINQKGEVVVTDYNGHCVNVFSPSGERLRSFGTHGSGPRQFLHPRGVAVDSEDNIFVADTDNQRIQKFTSQGELLRIAGSKGIRFGYPYSIAYNASNGLVYVTENANHRVQILDSDLDYIGAFGKAGHYEGQFINPRQIACDSAGHVYVADYGNDRIQVFTAGGKFLRIFGRRGEGRGEIKHPWGVAVDSSTSRVYVSEINNNCVSVFTSEGQFMTSIGRKGSGPGQFDNPHGLAVDSNGVVYVCDYSNRRVQLL